ncbi:sulfatase family protein [Flammeovirga agarivorans]|uniref:Sulfatase-like hydrolase/transferase n=1 Tax=Flammeovirga agarivorans TaxID=2726742 RepID=A0A7X8SQ59_9BACT|nr:sulfatase-like hydrolase/transferase [Flammeovirga agarivorans]NLR94361.1 sulfatase-like hydrolase/transferase [Flammeovirga agarivorans]
MKLISRILFTLCLLLLFNVKGISQQKPNIVFIVVDDMSPFPIEKQENGETRAFGFSGEKYVKTPFIDSLAADGIIYKNAYVSSSVCSPSRYTSLTGRYAGRCSGTQFMRMHPLGNMTRVENNTELETNRWNVAKVLKKHGYTTGFVGKSHIVENDKLRRDKYEENGFEEFPLSADIKDQKVSNAMSYNHNKWTQMIKENGFDYANAVYGANLKELYSKEANAHNIEWTTSAVLDFIDQNAKKKDPFFLYYATTVPHGPEPWRRVKGEFKYSLDADPNITGEGYIEKDYSFMPSRTDIKNEIITDKSLRKDQAWITWFDKSIQAIVDKLKKDGMYENTLIVISSDHGSYHFGKTTLYETGVKIPLMMHWPKGIEKGKTYNGLVQNIDFAPTFLDIAGIKQKKSLEMDGKSLLPTFKDQETKIHDYLFFELGFARGVLADNWKYIAVRYPNNIKAKIAKGGTFKGYHDVEIKEPYYTRNQHLGNLASKANPHYFEKDQLFDLTNDPTEEVNLFEQQPEKAKELKEILQKKLHTFKDRPFDEFTKNNFPQ